MGSLPGMLRPTCNLSTGYDLLYIEDFLYIQEKVLNVVPGFLASIDTLSDVYL